MNKLLLTGTLASTVSGMWIDQSPVGGLMGMAAFGISCALIGLAVDLMRAKKQGAVAQGQSQG